MRNHEVLIGYATGLGVVAITIIGGAIGHGFVDGLITHPGKYTFLEGLVSVSSSLSGLAAAGLIYLAHKRLSR